MILESTKILFYKHQIGSSLAVELYKEICIQALTFPWISFRLHCKGTWLILRLDKHLKAKFKK